MTILKESFGLNLRLLQIFGLHSPSKHKKIYKIYSCFIYLFMVTPVSLLSCVNLVFGEVDMTKMSGNAFIACQMASKIIKFLPFVINSEKIRKHIYTLENPYFVTYNTRHEKIIAELTYVCRRNCRIFFSFVIFNMFGLAFKPVLKHGKILPVDVWLPFDINSQHHLVYYLVYMYVTLGLACGAFSNGALDPLLSGMIYHVTAQLKILKNNLQFTNEDLPESEEQQNGVRHRRIQMCVEHHMAILEFVDNFEKLYSPVVFSQFAASVFVICVCCLYLSMVEPLTVMFFTIMVFLMTMLTEIFFYCYYGTTLYEENESLMQAVYMSKWYEYDIKSKRSLIILMERSKRPVIITAGKILDLSLDTFTMILRRAYSLLAVLKSYN